MLQCLFLGHKGISISLSLGKIVLERIMAQKCERCNRIFIPTAQLTKKASGNGDEWTSPSSKLCFQICGVCLRKGDNYKVGMISSWFGAESWSNAQHAEKNLAISKNASTVERRSARRTILLIWHGSDATKIWLRKKESSGESVGKPPLNTTSLRR